MLFSSAPESYAQFICIPIPVPVTVVVAPATDTNTLGNPHTVTATVTNSQGSPLQGLPVDFSVTGANTASGSGTTDSNGQASFTYTGFIPGTDTITASVLQDNCALGLSSAPLYFGEGSATKIWNISLPACSIPSIHGVTVVLTPDDETNTQFDEHTVTARVFGAPSDSFVHFNVYGANPTSGSAPLVSGSASFTYTGNNPGEDTILASVDESRCNGIHLDKYFGFDDATKMWTIFVIPESPIGIIALMGSSLAALGGFFVLRRKHGNSQPHSLGDLGI